MELRENRAEAADKISQYATSPEGEGVFRMPIEAAMALLASTSTADRQDYDGPMTRSQFNTSWMSLSAPPAVAAGAEAAPADDADAEPQTPPELADTPIGNADATEADLQE